MIPLIELSGSMASTSLGWRFHVAVKKGKLEEVEALLQQGASIESRDKVSWHEKGKQ